MFTKTIFVLILLAQSTIYTSGSIIVPSPHNDNRQINPDSQKCQCFKNSGPNNDVIAIVFPQNREVERLIVFVCRDVNDNRIIKYIPRYETQKIQDLVFCASDELNPISDDEIIKDMFIKSPHKTIEDNNDIPIIESKENVPVYVDNDLKTPEEVFVSDSDVTSVIGSAPHNDYKLSTPHNNLHDKYDQQYTYEKPDLSQYTTHESTSVRHVTQRTRYGNILHLNEDLVLPQHIGMNNLKTMPILYRNILEDSVIRDKNGLPVIKTTSYLTPNSHNGRKQKIIIKLQKDTKTNHDSEKNKCTTEIASTMIADEKLLTEETYNTMNILVKPIDGESSISKLSSNSLDRRTKDGLLAVVDTTFDERKNNNTNPKNSSFKLLDVSTVEKQHNSREVSNNEYVINKPEDELKDLVHPLNDVLGISLISSADLAETFNRGGLRPNADILKRSKVPEIDLSDKPFENKNLGISHALNHPLNNRRLGEMHTPRLSDKETPDQTYDQVYNKGKDYGHKPNEGLLYRSDVNSDEIFEHKFLTDILSKHKRLFDVLNNNEPDSSDFKRSSIIDDILLSSAAFGNNIYMSPLFNNGYTQNKYDREHLDLPLNKYVPIGETPDSKTNQIPVQDLQLIRRNNIPGLDGLNRLMDSNSRPFDLRTFAINIIDSIFPNLKLSQGGPKSNELVETKNESESKKPASVPEKHRSISRSGLAPAPLGEDEQVGAYEFLVENGVDDDDDDVNFRIIGGNAATGSGTPLSNRGRSGRPHRI